MKYTDPYHEAFQKQKEAQEKYESSGQKAKDQRAIFWYGLLLLAMAIVVVYGVLVIIFDPQPMAIPVRIVR